jgi:hypothetical protein
VRVISRTEQWTETIFLGIVLVVDVAVSIGGIVGVWVDPKYPWLAALAATILFVCLLLCCICLADILAEKWKRAEDSRRGGDQ